MASPIIISSKEIIRGESSSKYVSDAGFSPDSYNLNLTRKRGILDFAPSMTDRGGAILTDRIIASTYDKTLSGNASLLVDDSGSVYTFSSSGVLTKRQTNTDRAWTLGTTECLQFLGNLYASHETGIAKFDGSNLTTIDAGWWETGISGGVRHPMERVESRIYFGDANLIHAWDGTTSTAAWITLPTDVNITSLRKHPDGQHLIAFCGVGQDYSHTLNRPGRIYVGDTVTRTWIREIDIETQIEGSILLGGIVYVTYGRNVGYFNGNGITLLKRLADSATTYSHNLGAMEDILLVRDGRHVRAYGDLGAGKVWWRCASTAASTDGDISNIAHVGDNKIVLSYDNTGGDPFLKELDYDNTSSSGIFFSNRYDFPAETHIKRIEVIHKRVAGNLVMTCNDEEDNVVSLSEIITTDTVSSKTRREINYLCDTFQYRQGQGPGEIRLIRIFYEPTN